jgi:hypothetical protein
MPAMPPQLEPEHFSSLTAPLTLDVQRGEAVEVVALRVVAVTVMPAHRLRRAPFSLTLEGPRTPALPQGTYPFRHPDLGVIEIFVVPSAQDATSTRYEATFN